MPVDKELLEILACPKCKGGLETTEKEDGVFCAQCQEVYPVKEDLPILLRHEAEPYKPSATND